MKFLVMQPSAPLLIHVLYPNLPLTEHFYSVLKWLPFSLQLWFSSTVHFPRKNCIRKWCHDSQIQTVCFI